MGKSLTGINGGTWGRMSALDRIMTRVVKQPDGHWIWTGARWGLRREYGQVTFNRKRTSAHRAVWMLLRGPIPEGLELLHQCGQTLCVNPTHVRPGTHKENLAEAVAARGGVHWAPKGQKSGMARLTDEQVAEIRRRRTAGERQAALALAFATSQPNISYITNDKRWRT